MLDPLFARQRRALLSSRHRLRHFARAQAAGARQTDNLNRPALVEIAIASCVRQAIST